MKLHVEVTAEDIRSGHREECTACPIALALNRAIPDASASVSNRAGRVTVGGSRVGFRLSRQAVDFVAAFDDDRTVAPFAFDLDLPEATP